MLQIQNHQCLSHVHIFHRIATDKMEDLSPPLPPPSASPPTNPTSAPAPGPANTALPLFPDVGSPPHHPLSLLLSFPCSTIGRSKAQRWNDDDASPSSSQSADVRPSFRDVLLAETNLRTSAAGETHRPVGAQVVQKQGTVASQASISAAVPSRSPPTAFSGIPDGARLMSRPRASPRRAG